MSVSETGDSNKLFRLVRQACCELPLLLPRASPDNILSGDWPGSVRHSGSDRASTSLCIEPDTSDPSQETIFPGCLPLPEGSESVLASITDDRPNHHQTVWTLPVSKRVMPVNTTISETSEETSVLLLPCDQEPCVAWNYGGRVSLLDLAEMTRPGESGSAERETRKVRKVVQTRDQMATLFTSGMTRTVTFIPSANGSTSGGFPCIFKAGWSFCTLSILAPLSLPGEAGTSGNTGKFAGQRTARKTPARSDGQPGRHDTSPMGKQQVLLQLYS